jgi:hypothetical protein
MHGYDPRRLWRQREERTSARFRAPMHSRKTKKRRRLTACGGQVGAPHELFARPPLSPLFHLYTLAPLYLRL